MDHDLGCIEEVSQLSIGLMEVIDPD
jgi:hypothetical protein